MDDEGQIRQLEHEWIDAFRGSDATAFERILAEDFVFTGPNGGLMTKEQWQTDLASGALAVEAINLDDLQVRLFGDTAIAYGLATVKGRSKEGRYDGQYSYLDVYARRQGRWQAVLTTVNPSAFSQGSKVETGA